MREGCVFVVRMKLLAKLQTVPQPKFSENMGGGEAAPPIMCEFGLGNGLQLGQQFHSHDENTPRALGNFDLILNF